MDKVQKPSNPFGWNVMYLTRCIALQNIILGEQAFIHSLYSPTDISDTFLCIISGDKNVDPLCFSSNL
jgi:hypothetical protein